MLTFLNSIILAGLAAVALPLLIHLLTRQRLKRIEFSSVSFLKLLQAQKMRRVRLREIVLLILRTLIVLLLILAFARPALRGSLAGGVKAHANTTVAILLDNSLSMSRETSRGSVFRLAQDRALQVVDLLEEGDEAFLVLFSDHPVPVTPEATHNFTRLRQLIEEAQPSYRTTDVRRALAETYDLIAEAVNLNKEIYLLTDLQEAGWAELERDSLSVGAGAQLYILPVAPETRWFNLTVENVDYSDQLPEAGKPLRFAATVANRSPESAEQAIVELFVDRVRRAQHSLQLDPEDRQGISFTTVVAEPGIHDGYVEVTDNQLAADNRHFFTLNVPHQIRVLIVSDDPRSSFFLGTALRPDEQVHGVMVPETVTTDGLQHRDLDGFDVVILADLPSLDGDRLASVDRFVRQGGGLLILLGNRIDHHFYNDHLLARLCPAVIQEALGSPTQRSSYLTIDRIDGDHPVFRIFQRDGETTFSSPRFFMAYDVAPGEQVTTLASFNNGSPALLESRTGRGRVLFMATAVDPAWTDLPVRGAFLPLLHRSVHYLATAQPSDGQELLVGATLSRDLTALPEGQTVTCETPGGERIILHPAGQRGYTLVTYEKTDHPGIYRFYLGDQLLSAFAVNTDMSESDLKQLETDRARSLLGTERVFAVGPDAGLETAILQSRYGRELWKAALWGVFLLLAVEMVLGRSGRRKEKTGAGLR
jgi:hypothetical protein